MVRDMENIKSVLVQDVQEEITEKKGNANVLDGLRVRRITAKLRDAVIISLNDERGEMARFRNIELPDALRDLLVEDYQFTKTVEGRLEFELYFKPGVLPKQMPEARVKLTRADKAAKVAGAEKPKQASSAEGVEAAEPPVESKLPKAMVNGSQMPQIDEAPAKAVPKPGDKAKTEPGEKSTLVVENQPPMAAPTPTFKSPGIAPKTATTATVGNKPKDDAKK